jgi:L-asparaginase
MPMSSEGIGAGHVPAEVAPRLGDFAAKTPVVLALRAMTGPVFTCTYGYSGSEIDLIDSNLVPAGYLSGLRRCVKPSSLAVPGRIDAVAEAVAPYE